MTSYKTILLFLFLGMVVSREAAAQLDMLTYREAERLVQSLPELRLPKVEPRCQPMLSGGFEFDPDLLKFQARYVCGSISGQLIDNYVVNRKTGNVTTWGDAPVAVGDGETKSLARQLVEQARNRVLSANEAKCLASVAARSLPGWADSGEVSVDRAANQEEGKYVSFRAVYRGTDRVTELMRGLEVNPATGEVRDSATRDSLLSDRTADLRSKLLSLKLPAPLSEKDAVSLVLTLRIPSFLEAFKKRCVLSSSRPARWDQIEVGLACGDQWVPGNSVAVDINTGHVFNEETGQPLESAESERFFKNHLSAVQSARSKLEGEVAAACAAQ